MLGEIDTQVSGVDEVVDRLPVAAVNDDDQRVRPFRRRQP
jgi:hypothetical protein